MSGFRAELKSFSLPLTTVTAIDRHHALKASNSLKLGGNILGFTGMFISGAQSYINYRDGDMVGGRKSAIDTGLGGIMFMGWQGLLLGGSGLLVNHMAHTGAYNNFVNPSNSTINIWMPGM